MALADFRILKHTHPCAGSRYLASCEDVLLMIIGVYARISFLSNADLLSAAYLRSRFLGFIPNVEGDRGILDHIVWQFLVRYPK